MGHRGLNEMERRFAAAPPPRALARIATVTDDGQPHVVPVGWSWDDERQLFVLGGRDVPHTVRARHVRRRGQAAIVIDGLADGPGWSPWGLVVNGRARVDDGEGAILLHPDRVRSWNLESVTES
ncbi:pyridoxamine 5'-phosphate oxidase family protein [Ornithinicoccus halotolerans]|uniref:pyridoxamine 5'-phosphate oxidase family protein n=1 Tax=Ornithinicoccus halotolerans TaxID=1748220 RepID=UPI001294AC15|nr:pyridoxamine 5'-phosphate oxidase family protein [Ornithinicoccus halotolerans]